MKRFPVVVFALVLISALFSGCYFDNEETLYPQGACDTLNVKYSNQVSHIIANKCFDCHSNSTSPISGSDLSWEGYANLSGFLATDASTFLGCLKQEVGFTPMPKDRPKLSDCEIRTLEIWVLAGYPNN